MLFIVKSVVPNIAFFINIVLAAKMYFNFPVTWSNSELYFRKIQGGARNVIPLIVQVTHFYYYKNI